MMKFPPRLQDLVPPDAVKQLVDMVAQPALLSGIKEAASKLGLKEHWSTHQLQETFHKAKRWVETVADRFQSDSTEMRNCINATGELFSSRFLATPLSPEAIRAQSMVYEGFIQGKVAREYESKLLEWSNAQAVLVVDSLPQAIRLLESLPNAKQGWAIPKAESIRLPRKGQSSEAIDLRLLLDQLGGPIHEVGASNECIRQDIDAVFSKSPAYFLSVEIPDSTGVAHRRRDELLDAAKQHHAHVCELLLAGSLHAFDFLTPNPTLIRDRIDAGVDLVIMPGDGLLGGPGVGILFGKAELIEPMRQWASKVGIELSAATMAAFNASVKQSEDLNVWSQGSIGLPLMTSLENLGNRAKRLASQLEGAKHVKGVRVETESIGIGTGVWKGLQYTSPVLAIELDGTTVGEMQEKLADRDRPILVRAGRDLEIVMRTVDASEDRLIVDAFWPAEA